MECMIAFQLWNIFLDYVAAKWSDTHGCQQPVRSQLSFQLMDIICWKQKATQIIKKKEELYVLHSLV